jgi:hypothetical protein
MDRRGGAVTGWRGRCGETRETPLSRNVHPARKKNKNLVSIKNDPIEASEAAAQKTHQEEKKIRELAEREAR